MVLEITVSNKRSRQINFKHMQTDYFEITLTKDIAERYENGVKIPYHEFIKAAGRVDLRKFADKTAIAEDADMVVISENSEHIVRI